MPVSDALSVRDRDRLARLLAGAPVADRWEVAHMHAPLLCVLGVIDAPDEDYARAARRRFADAGETRERALALIDHLDRRRRAYEHAQRSSVSLAGVLWLRVRRRVRSNQAQGA